MSRRLWVSGACTALAALSPVAADATRSPAPAVGHTVFVFDRATDLGTVAASLGRVGARVAAFEHDGARRGGFASSRLSLADAVSFYRGAYATLDPSGADPQVFSVRFAGLVATADLGAMAPHVVRRVVVAPDDIVAVTPAADGADVATNPKVAPADVVPGKKAWSPERGVNDLYNNSGYCFPGIISCAQARRADLWLTFDRATPGNEFAADWAYEHDFKLYNEENWNTDGICPAPQRNDFWADQSAGIVYATNMPDPYLDTGASDNCRYHDLTIGSYNPDEFNTGTYAISIVVAPGDHGDSEYQMRAEALDKDCEYSPWCVGIGGFGEGDLLVGTERGIAPGCRTWVTGSSSAQC